MTGSLVIFKNILIAFVLLVLIPLSWAYQNRILAIILSLLLILEIFLLVNSIKYRGYFSMSKPSKWSEIKCKTCGFQGKPIHYEPNYLPILTFGKFLKYYIKQFPIEYGCPHCDNPRKNYKNIEFVTK